LWTIGEVPGTIYGMSEKGWTDQELFLYRLKHFLKYANPGRPLLLLLDGHSSHFELSSIEMAREKGIIILCLPPHTTHESQPLDSAVFGPLKKHWTNECHDFQQNHPGEVITKYNFSKLFSKAWLKSLSAQNLIAGFKNCGVYPFNRAAIQIVEEAQGGKHGNGNATAKTSSNNSPVPEVLEGAPVPDDAPVPSTNEHSTQPCLQGNIPEISDDLRRKFERRFDEGYDLPDPLYQKWLEVAHPGPISSLFPDAQALTPLQISGEVTPPPSSVQHPTPPSSTPAIETQLSNEYCASLDTFLESVKTKQTTSTRAITTARVLTSDKCYNVIKEKEMKKKAEEEKQKRKTEREEKKKIMLEAKQKKAEEKARKEAEKAQKARIAEESKTRKQQRKIHNTKATASSPKNDTSSLGKRSASSNRKAKKPHLEDETEQNFDQETQCCVCFADDYIEGDEWVRCTCSRWLHEDCILDVVEDSNGLPRLCPYCIA